MADLWQGTIPTFPRLQDGMHAHFVSKLSVENGAHPVTLLLPCHARELQTAAFQQMMLALRSATWLRRIVIGLDHASEADHETARHLACGLPMESHVLWLDGPEWRERLLECPASAGGKGRNVWLSLGWILEKTDADVIALHDCDILPYDLEMLARLVFPIASPEMGFRFCKGYYARFSDRLHGRLSRLMVQPMAQLMADRNPFLKLLAACRYPLSGEVAFDASLAREMRFLPGWSLELGMLAEMERLGLLSSRQMCQAELCGRYDHRHQPLRDDAGGGLVQAAMEIAQTFVELGELNANSAAEAKSAILQAVAISGKIAAMNGLNFAPEEEMTAASQFATLIQEAAARKERASLTWLPAWNTI